MAPKLVDFIFIVHWENVIEIAESFHTIFIGGSAEPASRLGLSSGGSVCAPGLCGPGPPPQKSCFPAFTSTPARRMPACCCPPSFRGFAPGHTGFYLFGGSGGASRH